MAAGTCPLVGGSGGFRSHRPVQFRGGSGLNIGGGMTAYFQAGSPQVVAIPAPALAWFGMIGLLRRCRV